MEVVRIGTYNLVADGMYLEYSPESGLVSELARQPSATRAAPKICKKLLLASPKLA
jgi:biopolymer transport protein ExbB